MTKNSNNIDNSPLFEDEGFDPSSLIDGEEIIHIDTDTIDSESITYAEELVKNLSESYFDDEFFAENPVLKKRLSAELESLRILVRMRKSDEQVHDIALKAIGGNSGNASLYRALNETQKTLISIQTKIDETVDRITNMLKTVQLEINFEDNPESIDDDSIDENGTDANRTYRGSKSFIEDMKKKEVD
jgi:hypothetical protein